MCNWFYLPAYTPSLRKKNAVWNRWEGIVRNSTREKVSMKLPVIWLILFLDIIRPSDTKQINMSITTLSEHEAYSLACFMLQIYLHDISALFFLECCARWDEVETRRKGQRIKLWTRFWRKNFCWKDKLSVIELPRSYGLLGNLKGALCVSVVTYLFFMGIIGGNERAALFDRKYENQGLDIRSDHWETYGLMNWVEGLTVHGGWEDYSAQDVCMHSVIPEK